MQHFLKKTILFLIAFFLFDKLFYFFIAVSPSLECDTRLEKVLKGKMNKDIIVLGSSRGARNIIAGQIEDSLGFSAYNLSYPGSDIEFHEFILRTLIQFNEAPKMVLLAIDDPREFLPSQLLTFRLERLYPLAKNKYINDEMIARGEKNISSKALVLSRMNIRNLDIRRKRFTYIDSINSCGSMPISSQREGMFFQFDSVPKIYQTDYEQEYKVNSFQKLQQHCVENNIELILIFSPNFKVHSAGFENRMKLLTEDQVTYMLYDSLNPIYTEESYYFDHIHLQKNGATVFTNEIIEFLKKHNTAQLVYSPKPMNE